MGRNEVFEHLGLSESLDGIDGFRKRAGEQERSTLAGGVAFIVSVDRFGRGVSTCGNVVSDRALQVADPIDLFADIHQVEVQMLATYKEDVGATPGGLEDLGYELHEATGLPVALVLFEKRDDVFDGGMERVRSMDVFGDLFGALG